MGFGGKKIGKAEVQEYTDELLRYTNDTPTPAASGGIDKGETFDNVSYNDIITKALYPYVAPTVTAATTPAGGVFECGTTKTVTAVTAKITKGSADITKVEAFNGTSSLGSSASVSTVNSTGSGSVSVTVSADIKTNATLKVTVTDKQNKQTSANATAFTFVYPYYQGVIAADAEADETAVKELTKIVQAKGTKSVTYTAANQKMVFATPKSYGAIKTITDPNSFNVTDTFTQTEVSITGLGGKPQDYYVYTSNPTTVSAFKMTFAY